MLKRYFSVLFFLFLSIVSNAQDIPLFSQKMTNSLLYNPSFAGHRLGSATFSHRGRNNVIGDATTNFVSIHSPIMRHKAGVGINVFQEDINVLSNIFVSGAFAYHINTGDYKSLSFGVSGTYSNTTLNTQSINAIGSADITNPTVITAGNFQDDPVLVDLFNNNDGNIDFAFGTNFQTRYFKLGGSINRLATTFRKETAEIGNTDVSLITNFYTGYAHFMVPVVGNRDLFEPILTVRKLSNLTSPQYDLGMYYTYNEQFVLGASYHTGDGSFPGVSAAFIFNKQFWLGYSHSWANITGFGGLGSTSEFTLRFDFFKQSYQTRFNKYSAKTKSAMAYRRKTLTKQITRKPSSLRQPSKNYHKRFKRGRDVSPNRRYKRPAQRRKKVNNRRRGSFKQRW